MCEGDDGVCGGSVMGQVGFGHPLQLILEQLGYF